MGDKSIKKEPKKKKKTDTNSPAFSIKPVMTQPELIKKKKKDF